MPEDKDKILNPPPLGPDPDPEEVLDVAIEYTFPASDPISVAGSFQHARERKEKAANAKNPEAKDQKAPR